MPAAGSTTEVVARHVQAFFAGDLDALVADFAEGAVLCTPDGALRGRAQIRGFFERVAPLFPAGATTFAVRQQILDGELLYAVWSASSPAVEVPFAADVYLVRDGQIARLSFGGQLLPKQA